MVFITGDPLSDHERMTHDFCENNLGKIIELGSITDIRAPANRVGLMFFLIAHFQRMNEVDRYTRFFSAVSDDGLRNIVNRFDWSRMIAVGPSGIITFGHSRTWMGSGQSPVRAELANVSGP